MSSTIHEVREARRKLELNILNQIREFEKAHDVTVNDVTLSYSQAVGDKRPCVHYVGLRLDL